MPGKTSQELGVGINLWSDYHLMEGKIGGGEELHSDTINVETGMLSCTKVQLRMNKKGHRDFKMYQGMFYNVM